jgi:predicted proteasome-type protease
MGHMLIDRSSIVKLNPWKTDRGMAYLVSRRFMRMTLVLAVVTHEGIVIAGDSRGCAAELGAGFVTHEDTYKKLRSLGRCGLAVAGAGEVAQTYLHELERIDFRPDDVDQARDLIVERCQEFTRGRTIGWSQEALATIRCQLLLAGYTHGANPRPCLYHLDTRSGFFPALILDGVPGVYPIGVYHYADYLKQRYFNPGFSLLNATRLAHYLVAETMTVTTDVGPPIRLAQITPTDGYQDVSPAIVAAIAATNAEWNDSLSRGFEQQC